MRLVFLTLRLVRMEFGSSGGVMLGLDPMAHIPQYIRTHMKTSLPKSLVAREYTFFLLNVPTIST
jgi:hypothetical protein